ncbi:MAG: GIY-YIG nuclease family protein [Chloroflexi bacterium]|nr:GIY-YIG nuclease family protein [Chloroflexota bacterium]
MVRNSQCVFWDCAIPTGQGQVFCEDHFQDSLAGKIDECPECHRAKHNQYDVCLDCYDKRTKPGPTKKASPVKPAKPRRYTPESSPTWDKKRDAESKQFFAYILKLDGGEFYAGQTRELRERLSEHMDGRTRSTVGKNPKLVWFTTLASRKDATEMEVELKKLIDSNPREIRRMYIEFKDLVGELNYD